MSSQFIGNSGNSYSSVGTSGIWDPVAGNLAYHVFLDCGDNCEDDSCSNASGDVNEDGDINVFDVGFTIDIILWNLLPSELQFLAADLNADNAIDVIDVILIVEMILG